VNLRRSALAVLAILWITFVIYTLFFLGLLRRTMLVMFPIHHLNRTDVWKPRPDEDPFFGVAWSDVSHDQVFWFLVVTFTLPPVLLTTIWAMETYVRWSRARRDCCLACGRRLSSWRGRCPGCGALVGPDPTRLRLDMTNHARR
jgi:hypothetical protein